jgi:hypothetical protein
VHYKFIALSLLQRATSHKQVFGLPDTASFARQHNYERHIQSKFLAEDFSTRQANQGLS